MVSGLPFAAISKYDGIVVREAALSERGVALSELLTLFEVADPLDQRAGVISFGPHFGREASDELCARLERAGLRYVEDYFVLTELVPDWCGLGARLEG